MNSIDVIVPCYRYGQFLDECVGSVLAHNDLAVRVLIIDDASPDGSFDVAKRLAESDSRVTARQHADNRGHIATYNEGLEWASADYVLLLSADDLVTPGSLWRATQYMSRHPQVGFVYGKALNVTGGASVLDGSMLRNLQPFNRWRQLSGVDFIRSTMALNPVPTPTAIVRTHLQKQVGGYRPDLPHSGDLEMWFRLAARAAVGVTDDYQGVYRLHDANMHRSFLDVKDFLQRRDAINAFFESSSSLVEGAGPLHEWLFEKLAEDAVASASMAFNRGDQELMARLCDLAKELSPVVRFSRRWRKLQLKRVVGPRVWSVLKARL